jgi:serine/threonine protein kinase
MMDYCGVGSVVDLIEDSGSKLTEHMVAYIMCSTLIALNYLNGRNIIHRDVKARNILVNKDGDCKLADFGVSKSLHRYMFMSLLLCAYY